MLESTFEEPRIARHNLLPTSTQKGIMEKGMYGECHAIAAGRGKQSDAAHGHRPTVSDSAVATSGAPTPT